jgi:AraC-like DNA-binding protein
VVLQGPATPFICRREEWGSQGFRLRLASHAVLPLLEGLRPSLAADVSRGIPTPPIARFCPPRPYLRLRLLQGREARALPWDPTLLDNTAQEILKAILVTPPQAPLPPRQRRTRLLHRRWVRRSKTLLAQRYGEDLRIADIAEAVGASPYHLSRIFKRVAGMSPHQYRIRLRLAVSLDRLVQGETDLGRLAATVGFSSHSHFTRAFSAEFGASPKDVRQWLNEPGELTRLPGVLPVPMVFPVR